MGNKARRIRSGKFARKFATLREKAAERMGLTKEQPAPAEAAPPVAEAVAEVAEAPEPASTPKPAKKAPARKSRKKTTESA